MTSPTPVQAEVAVGLQTLAAQVALALESVALTEVLTRQRSEARVGALVQNSSDVIMVLDAGLEVRYVTPSVSRVLGHRPEDQTLYAYPAAGCSQRPASRDGALLPAGLARSGECPRGVAGWRGHGRLTDVETVSIDFSPDHPGVSGIVVTIRDITDRKALQAGLQHHIRELKSSTGSGASSSPPSPTSCARR